MSDTTAENTGSYQPPVAPTAGDDGYVAPGSVDLSGLTGEDPARAPRMNASDIRSQIAANLDSIAASVDWSKDEFAKQGVARCFAKWGEFNWIMCHSAHSYLWMGARGVDWEHWHYELDVYGAGTFGYEVYWAREGVFSLNGDGGFINWAYIGNVQKLDSKTLYFSPP